MAIAILLVCAGCACGPDPCCDDGASSRAPTPAPDAAPSDAPPGPTDADQAAGPAIVGSGGRYDG